MSAWAPALQLGPYVLLAPIGSGGMGEVWKARDTRLDRIVAIKRLKSNHNERFEQEARAIAALNHPNICQIYDVGPDYLVLEFVEGSPVRGPLPQEQALRLAIQMAGALEAAHRKGIVHRDLKPANILVTGEGTVKLLDFGLAKLVAPSDSDATRTLEGAVMGTAAYMSPEQAEGKLLDERSDIFSFGAVLYEMLSGTQAFGGPSAAHAISSILRDEPRKLQAAPVLASMVMRCLRKAPAARFQTAAELKAALEQQAVKPTTLPPSIAVLPFANMSGDIDNEYFSDGLAEEIINALAQIPGLKVIARTSAFAFKGKNEDVRRIAETLGVAHILEGSVRRAGSRIRVTAQLIAALDGSHLWSERYDRELADVFAIQDEIAQAIAGILRVKLSAEPAGRRRHTPSLPAYEALLKARHDSLNYAPEASARSRMHYEEAIALDPEFALAHAELGIQFLTQAIPSIAPAREVMPLARAAALRALELDPSLPEAHALLGAVAGLFEYDWKEAERRFLLALAHEPVAPSVRFLYAGSYLQPLGKAHEAAAENERGLQDDPFSFGGRIQLAGSLLLTGRFADAERETRKDIITYESAYQPPVFLAFICAVQGRLAEAVASAEKAHELAPWHSHPSAMLAGLLVRAGDRPRAEALIHKLPPPQTYGVPSALTFFHILSGDFGSAAEWCERAIEQRDPRIVIGLRHPLFAPFLADPRGRALWRKMNLPETG
ncbi:MAG: protein kinase [Acidobacteriia bacterium]|nr:protein kinase [Terriglobia bacterium]